MAKTKIKATKYSLTPEHRAQFEPWRDKWISNAMSTAAMTNEDQEICRDAVVRLYRAANLPPPQNIVFTTSPFAARFAAGFAAWIWHLRATNLPVPTPREPIFTASEPNLDNWYVCSSGMVELADALGVGKAGLDCAVMAGDRLHQGGNQWPSYDSFLSFFRHIAKLPLDYSKWDAWETLALHSGPRYVHANFCIISDRPELLVVDDARRPHSLTGPFCRWRDGSALYAVHGTRIPAKWIEDKDFLTPSMALKWGNIEERRAACEILGWNNILDELRAKVIDTDYDPEIGQLVEVTMPNVGRQRFLRVRCGTGRDFAIPVALSETTALEANARSYGISPDFLRKKEHRT
jgi:hypothetical protein